MLDNEKINEINKLIMEINFSIHEEKIKKTYVEMLANKLNNYESKPILLIKDLEKINVDTLKEIVFLKTEEKIDDKIIIKYSFRSN